MRVAIAGAEAVGRSFAQELITNGHQVLLIDKNPVSIKPDRVPEAEWLFTEAWGVDVSVSTPRIMSALVEEAVTVGDLVRLFTFRQGNANLVELTLPDDSPYVGKPTGLIPFPENCALVTILRDGQVYTPDADQPIESGDELLFVAGAEVEDALERILAPSEHGEHKREN